jgi:molybdopterin adenylyltransferase
MDGRNPRSAVLTISDRCARGEQPDRSGPELVAVLRSLGWTTPLCEILPDEEDRISTRLIQLADAGCDLILTVGGTGLSPRDRTPEATQQVADRVIPGLGERMRAATAGRSPRAYLSRGIAATRGRCLIVNLPGSARGAVEMFHAVADLIPHALDVICEAPGGRGAHDPQLREPDANPREDPDAP